MTTKIDELVEQLYQIAEHWNVCDAASKNNCIDKTVFQERAKALLDEYLPKWIPCSEKLPDQNTVVLVYSPNSDHWYNQDVDFIIPYSAIWCNCKNVTHWMPLPEKPEGE